MNASKLSVLALILTLIVVSCKKEEEQLTAPPTAADAAFTYTPTSGNPNIIDFALVNSGLQAIWDLGNGLSAEGTTAQGIYPNAGTYTVSVTVFNAGGSASSSQDIEIENSDPSLLSDPLYTFLTGGASGDGSKTWVIDSLSTAHMGVGPDPIGAAGDYPEYWAANPLDKAGVGLYDDRYVFHFDGFQYDMVNNGDVYIHNSLADDFPGSFENLADYTAPYTDQLEENWNLSFAEDTTITTSGDAFIGMFTGPQEYKVLLLNDTALWLQYAHHEGGLLWYLRLMPEGFESSGSGPQTWELPQDFETVEPTFTTFGNSGYGIIDNPDPSGINTSSRVLETVHGNESWAGLYIDLTDPLDFSTQTSIGLKLWAPIADSLRVKVENSSNPSDFVEVDVVGSTTDSWEQMTLDFSGVTSGIYDRLVLFPGWGTPDAGTFYIDDIEQQ